jgi:hypothetical protein
MSPTEAFPVPSLALQVKVPTTSMVVSIMSPIGWGRGGGGGPVEACPSGGGPHGIVQNPGFVVVGTHVEVCLWLLEILPIAPQVIGQSQNLVAG